MLFVYFVSRFFESFLFLCYSLIEIYWTKMLRYFQFITLRNQDLEMKSLAVGSSLDRSVQFEMFRTWRVKLISVRSKWYHFQPLYPLWLLLVAASLLDKLFNDFLFLSVKYIVRHPFRSFLCDRLANFCWFKRDFAMIICDGRFCQNVCLMKLEFEFSFSVRWICFLRVAKSSCKRSLRVYFLVRRQLGTDVSQLRPFSFLKVAPIGNTAARTEAKWERLNC